MASLTEKEARALVIAEARRWVGYNPGRTYSYFGEWYGPGWSGALWCALGCSYFFNKALGEVAAKLVIGYESTAPRKRGYAWTVAFQRWLDNNGSFVSLKNAQSGDLLFFKYPTSDNRNTNPVNHVDIVESNSYSKGYLTTIGPNTPRPGTAGDPSNGRGCWRHNRSIYDRYIVGAWRPRWSALVIAPPVEVIIDLTRVAVALKELGYPVSVEGVRAYQSDKALWGHNLTVDGVPGPATEKAIGETMGLLQDIDARTKQIEKSLVTAGKSRDNLMRKLNAMNGVLSAQTKQINTVGRIARESREFAKSVPERTAAFMVPFSPTTSIGKIFGGKKVRLGALLGYAAAAFYDRDQHTEEIVEALDLDALADQGSDGPRESDDALSADTAAADEASAEAAAVGTQAELDPAVDVASDR